MTVDVQKLVEATSKYTESDDLMQIFKPVDPDMQIEPLPGPYPQPLQGQQMRKAEKNQGGQIDGRLGIKEDLGAVENAELRNNKQEN